MSKPIVKTTLVFGFIILMLVATASTTPAQLFRARDPGLREGDPAAGKPLPNLKASERKLFDAGLADFLEVEGLEDGLGPRFNLDSCSGCHAQPATGGTSPATNPQVALATLGGAKNKVPSFITVNGPIREARYQYKADGSRDGGVHALYVVSGRVDATGDASACDLKQEDFETQVARDNVIFRIPTPTFGAGLIEQIPDKVILRNLAANAGAKQALGISGRVNRSGNDGTITRFGWKAQNKSLLIFSGEAYNVEMGITNEAFPQERAEEADCQVTTTPNDVTAAGASGSADTLSAIEKFAFFMRFLAPPTPASPTPSANRGRQLFTSIGCTFCHTPTLKTGDATVAALSNQDVNLYSDLALHAMGPGLADDILQGGAAGDEFRTAPLWGLGQRIFFLHDGRTTDLIEAIRAHKSPGNRKFGPSEANAVIDRFNGLEEHDKQDVVNFLRSL